MGYDLIEILLIFLQSRYSPILMFCILLVMFRKEVKSTISNYKIRKFEASDIIIVSIFIVPLIMLIDYNMFTNYFSEFIAGTLGILLAFSLERRSIRDKEDEEMMLIKNGILFEIEENVELIKKLKEIPPINLMDTFYQFQNTAWDIFKNRLKLDTELMLDLGKLYFHFNLFNDCLKYAGQTFEITDMLKNYPNFFDNLLEDSKSILTRL